MVPVQATATVTVPDDATFKAANARIVTFSMRKTPASITLISVLLATVHALNAEAPPTVNAPNAKLESFY